MLVLEGQIHEANRRNANFGLIGRFDLAFLAATVAPLLLILPLHDLRSGERVAGRPRYSIGYGDYARIPTVLVEMHNLKPHRQRVLGAYAMIEGALRTAAHETSVFALLERHRVACERIDTLRTMRLDQETIGNARLEPVHDTRVRMAGELVHEVRPVTMPAGSLRVPHDQPRGLRTAALLEPEAVDSLFSWGFFIACWSRLAALNATTPCRWPMRCWHAMPI